jgi:HNH endonuclease
MLGRCCGGGASEFHHLKNCGSQHDDFGCVAAIGDRGCQLSVCLLQSAFTDYGCTVDRGTYAAEVFGGTDDRENLVAACYRCNEFKGAKIEARDPETQQMSPLFNPRKHRWADHLVWENGGTHVRGITPLTYGRS